MSITVEERLKANKLEMIENSPGTLISFSSKECDREMIVDNRASNDEFIPLLGREGGHYVMEVEGNVVTISSFSAKRGRWITAFTINVQDIETDFFN